MEPLKRRESRTDTIVDRIRDLIAGKSNGPRGTLTITANQATTTVTDERIAANASVQLTQTSAAAAAEVASTYVGAVQEGQFTVNHPNNATTGRTFAWVAHGG